jgi:hypothetical protein
MSDQHNPKARFGLTLAQANGGFQLALTHTPPLPAVAYAALGKAAPIVRTTAAGRLPAASTIILTWADAEWAALHHVFCGGSEPMPYADRARGGWPGWTSYAADLPGGAPRDWNSWGSYCLVEMGANPVLLFKSNTHLDWPGAPYLKALIDLLVREVQPRLILSTGTAGGTKPEDHIGTVRAVSAGTLYAPGSAATDWPVYRNAWKANSGLLAAADFDQLLFPVPTNPGDLQTLGSHFNRQHGTRYPLGELDPGGLNLADTVPQIDDQTGGAASLLTAASFLVGTTSGTYQAYSCIEMDDAVVAEACAASATPYGVIRNLSDPVQNAALPPQVQGAWASAIYDAYGFYTSYNSALAAWAVLA